MSMFTGVIEDVNDPKQMNRVRVRVFGLHSTSEVAIPTEDLPWATVLLPTTSAGISGIGQTPHGLIPGSWVMGFFQDKAMQDPVILGSVASMFNEAPPGKTFKDPEGNYPTEEYIGEPDVNKAARGEHKVVDAKKENVKKNVKTIKQTWSEPETKYAPVYPHNKVIETTSGHLFEVDDTEGAERISEHHKSGTFREVHPDGTVVNKIKGENFTILAKGNNVYIEGAVNLTINNTCNMQINGDWNIEVTGNMDLDVKGTIWQDSQGGNFYLNKDRGNAWAAARKGDTADTGDAGTGSHFDSNSAGSDLIETGSGSVFIGQ